MRYRVSMIIEVPPQNVDAIDNDAILDIYLKDRIESDAVVKVISIESREE